MIYDALISNSLFNIIKKVTLGKIKLRRSTNNMYKFIHGYCYKREDDHVFFFINEQ